MISQHTWAARKVMCCFSVLALHWEKDFSPSTPKVSLSVLNFSWSLKLISYFLCLLLNSLPPFLMSFIYIATVTKWGWGWGSRIQFVIVIPGRAVDSFGVDADAELGTAWCSFGSLWFGLDGTVGTELMMPADGWRDGAALDGGRATHVRRGRVRRWIHVLNLKWPLQCCKEQSKTWKLFKPAQSVTSTQWW